MVNTPNYDLDIDSTLGGDNASDYVIPSQKAIKSYVDNNMGSTVDQVYDPTSQAAQSGVAIAGANFLTSSDLTNYLTTNTAQNITGVKTFVGNKLLKFKGVNSSSKLGFTAFDNNNREVGYLEGAGSGNSAHTFRLGIYDTTNTNYDNKLGFEYYKAKGSDGVLHRYNLLCPPLYPSTTAQDFYIPMSITNGTTTVNADNTGNIDISTLFPSVGNGTITINQGDIQKGTFTVNQSGNTTIDLDSITNPLTFSKVDGSNTYTYTSGFNSNNRYYSQVTTDSGSGGSTIQIPSIYTIANGGAIIVSSTTTSNSTFETVRTFTLGVNVDNATIKIDNGGKLYASIPTIDQIFDDTSLNAQSGVAIAGELTNYQATLVSGINIKTVNNTSLLGSGNISVLQNTATGSQSLTILGTAQTAGHGTNVGYYTQANEYSNAFGHNAKATGEWAEAFGGNCTASGNWSVVLGHNNVASGYGSTALGCNASATANYAIQLGEGTNSNANSLQIGFGTYNYTLLDGTTGLIPDDRISTNIARASDVADTDLSNLSSTGEAKFQAPLGYTPVNKTGDTMTGSLSVESGGINSIGQIDPRISIISDTEIAGTLPSSTINKSLVFRDKNNTWLGSCGNIYNTNGSRYTRITSQNGDGSSSTDIRVGFDANDNTFTFAPNPSSTSNDNNIATTSFVRKWAYGNVVKKSTDIISSNTSLNGSTDITYNLGATGYLPSDYTTYPYAVYLSAEGVAGNTVGNYITIALSSALVDNVYVAKCKTYVANSQALCGWGGWFPIGTDGRIYLARNTNWNGHINAFRARAYCRMN